MPPINDAFASATTITGASGTQGYDTTDATFETGEYYSDFSKTVWYKYTPATTGWYEFYLDSDYGAPLNRIGQVFSGVAVNALTQLSAFYYTEATQPENEVYLTAGVQYHIRIVGNTNDTGNFLWAYRSAPANDNFANRETITGSKGNKIFNEATAPWNATEEGSEPNVSAGVYSTVWYEWVAPSSGNFYFAASRTQDHIFVYSGTSLGSLTQLATSTYGVPGLFTAVSGTAYKIQFRVLEVDVSDYNMSFFWWPSVAAPVNDNIASATVLTGTSGSQAGTLVGSTIETGDEVIFFDHGDNATAPYFRSVWYKYVAPTNGEFFFDIITDGGFSPYVEFYLTTAPSPGFGDLNPYVFDSGDGTTNPPSGSFILTAGSVLYFYVTNWNFDPQDDDFDFTWNFSLVALPPYDNIANAYAWNQNGASNTVTFVTNNATDQGESSVLGEGIGVWSKLVFPSWTASNPNPVGSVRAVGDDLASAPKIKFYKVTNALFNPASPNFSYLQAINTPNVWNNTSDTGTVSVTLAGVQTSMADDNAIYVLILDTNATETDIQLTMTWSKWPAASNNTYNSQHVGDNRRKGVWALDLTSSTMESGEPNHGGVNPAGSVWFRWFGDHTGDLTFRITRVWGDLTDPVLAIYTGNTVSTLTLVGQSTAILPSVTIPAYAASTTLRISVAKRDLGDDGGCILEWSYDAATATNQQSSDAVTITGSSGTATGLNFVGSHMEFGDPELNYYPGPAPLWYKWTCPVTGVYKFALTGASHKAHLKAFIRDVKAPPTGNLNPQLRTVAEPDINPAFGVASTERVTRLNGFAGVEYYIAGYYYVGADAATPGLLGLAWSLESAPLDITNSGGSYTDSTYQTITVGSSTRNDFKKNNLEAQDHYLSFTIKYGTIEHFEGGQTSTEGGELTFLQFINSNGDVIMSGKTAAWNTHHELNDHAQIGGAYGLDKITDDYEQHVLILFKAIATGSGQSRAHVWINGSYAGRGTMNSTGGTPEYALNSIRLGNISDTSIVDKTIAIGNIRLVSAEFYDKPGTEYGWDRVEGFEEGLSTSDYINKWRHGHSNWGTANHFGFSNNNCVLGNTPGRGRGVFFDHQTSSGSLAALMGIPSFYDRHKVSRVGWCFYMTDAPTDEVILAEFQGSNKYLIILGGDDPGQLVIAESSTDIVSDTTFASVKLDTGRWHHIEIAIDPRQLGQTSPMLYWCINGEEQTPVPYSDYSQNVLYKNDGLVNIGMWTNTTPSARGIKGWITDVSLGAFNGTWLGPVKTELIVPNGSGTHVLTSIESLDWEGGGPGAWQVPPLSYPDPWFRSTDGGTTTTVMGTTDAIHTLVDEWPPTWTSATEDLVAELSYSSGGSGDWQIGYGSYVELLQSGTSYTNLITVSPVLAYRGFDKTVVYFGGGGLSSESYNIATEDFPPCFATKLVNSDGEITFVVQGEENENPKSGWTKLRSLVRAPGNLAWTPARLDAISLRWGWKAGFRDNIPVFPFYPTATNGICLDAIGLEIAASDTQFAPAPVSTSVPGTVDINSYWAIWTPGTLNGTTRNSCDAQEYYLSPGTDPNMKGVVYWDPYFDYINYPYGAYKANRADVRMFFRILPAQDALIPGLDGSFHDTPTDETNGTTSWHTLSSWQGESGEFSNSASFRFNSQLLFYSYSDDFRKFAMHSMYPWSQFPLPDSFSLYFDACNKGRYGTWDSNREVTLEVYLKASDGTIGPTTTATWSVERGLCCTIGDIHLSRIRYRAFQQGNV